MASNLYRRPSGIYAVRLVVPPRLRSVVGRGELHTSTSCRTLSEATIAALRIQLHWRSYFMALDPNTIQTRQPALAGDGFVTIPIAAAHLGLDLPTLIAELLITGTRIQTFSHGWIGWVVPELSRVDREDGTYIINSAELLGEFRPYWGEIMLTHYKPALNEFLTRGTAQWSSFRTPDGGGLLLEYAQDIALSAAFVEKTAIEKVRLRLAANLPPSILNAPMSAEPATRPSKPLPMAATSTGGITSSDVNSTASPVVVLLDPIEAKHGHKRFSELFEMLAEEAEWGASQREKMTKEAQLFRELMGDPPLAEIDKALILKFAKALSHLPTNIYLGRRRMEKAQGPGTLKDLIEFTSRQGLETKNERTIKNHIGRISEILGYGEKEKMLISNPAANYKRSGWDKDKRPQDERAMFSDEELNLIFSQSWFKDGKGKFARSGFTQWRPFYYWLPILGLTTGARINELCQLYLDDIRKVEGHDVWYLDFNLVQPDKLDQDTSKTDKSLKSPNSIRTVPIHSTVIRLGFIEYVETLREEGWQRLFPEITRDPTKGYGKPASSWFNERFLGRDLKLARDGMKVFHSFRHTFLDAVARLQVTEREIAELAGHVRGKTESWKRYVKDRQALTQSATIERLTFPALAGVAKFNINAGLVAIREAQRRKVERERD